MNFEKLDKDLRSVLLQYMCDPEIIDVIKTNVNIEDSKINYVEQKYANYALRSSDSSETLISKMDEILAGQQRIESLIKSASEENCNENNKTDDNSEIAKNALERENIKLKKEHEHTIAECKDLIARYQSQNQILEDHNSRLKTKNEDFEKENKRLISKVEELEKEISQLRIQCESELQEVEDIKNKYDLLEKKYSVFSKPLKICDSLKILNDENKDYLEKLSGSISEMSILTLARDDGKVDQLWTYIRDLAVEGKQDSDQIEILASFFEFCIDISTECKEDKEKYRLFGIEPGNEFDMDTCIRSAGSKQIGNVSRTIVRGVRDRENVRFKAIVFVE